MKDNSVLKLGGLFAILLGIAKLLGAILYFVVPPEQRLDVRGAVLLPSVAQDSTMLFAIFWLESLAGILGLAVMEATLLLVSIIQRYHLTLSPDQRIELWPALTLRPRQSIHMNLSSR